MAGKENSTAVGKDSYLRADVCRYLVSSRVCTRQGSTPKKNKKGEKKMKRMVMAFWVPVTELKRFMFLLFIFFLVSGLAGGASAAPKFVYDYDGVTSGITKRVRWKDVNKENVWDPACDSLMCFAAAASNSLAWTLWDGGHELNSEYEIYGYFRAHWPNEVSTVNDAYCWWFTGDEYDPDTDPTLPGGNFYNEALLVDNATLTHGPRGNKEAQISLYIDEHRGITILIRGVSSSGLPYSHSVTVWGMDEDRKELYITDSDDGLTALVQYSYYQSESDGFWYIQDYTNRYTDPFDFQIRDVFGFARNTEHISPVNVPPASEPTIQIMKAYVTGGHGVAGARFLKGDYVTYNIDYRIEGANTFLNVIAKAVQSLYPGCEKSAMISQRVVYKGNGEYTISWRKRVPSCLDFSLAGSPYWVDVDWSLKLKTYDGKRLLDQDDWSEADVFAVELYRPPWVPEK
jgi:hypothetical protein